MPERLAIHGDTPVLAPDTVRPWPAIDEIDARDALASLRGRGPSRTGQGVRSGITCRGVADC